MFTQMIQQTGVSAGWLTLAFVGIAVVGYFLGCCNGAVMVSRGVLKDDIRLHGSGNGGLTNFCRIHGGGLSLLVIFIDVAKAVITVLLAAYIFGLLSPELVPLGKYWGGLFCMLGHMFPCMYQFRGGKGVLSGGTMAILIDWRVALVVWGIFLILAVLTRYVSLGSLFSGVLLPIISGIVYRSVPIVVISTVIGLLIIFQHRGNLARLIKGTESKFTFKHSTPPPAPAGEKDEGSKDQGDKEEKP